MSVSLLDIGYQLASALVDIERTGRGQYSASDDGLEVSFALTEGSVVIATNHFESTLRVPADAFRRGCRKFLTEIAQSLTARAPKLLEWQSVAPITAYAPS